jgi:hypothetical protein
MPANGVEGLLWLNNTAWRCEACGRRGVLPAFGAVGPFARVLGDLKREHSRCHSGAAPDLPVVGVGDPLNPDRAER